MCCHLPLKLNLGGAKVYIEAAEVYRRSGHQVSLVGINEIVGENEPYMDQEWRVEHYPAALRSFILQKVKEYDVIEFESIYLPFAIPKTTHCLLVARSILLDLHFLEIKIPHFPGIRALAGLILKSFKRKSALKKRVNMSLASIAQADFVNVPNPSDKDILIKYGVNADKIIVHPYGIFQDTLDRFSLIMPPKENKKKLIIAFIGTFDNRKGAVEFPIIIRKILERYEHVEFKLMGVIGMFPSAGSIHRYIGEDLKNRIRIHEKYSPEELPNLLSECTLGIFPSYIESFGFGVLEMMAMKLPVVGYNSPGINNLLLSELIVQPGDLNALFKIMDKIILDEAFRKVCIEECSLRVKNFTYENQENFSLQNYRKSLSSRSF
jgi:glycosyltransferase involved in cell wall biosynthesis